MGEITNAAVCLLGMGTVFFGLIMIVFFCKLMSAIIQRYDRDSSPDKPQQTAPVTAVPEVPAPIPENLEIAVSAALSEMLNTDLSNIRISSWREYQETEIPNRQEVVAAVSAAIAEMLNTDIAGIRIVSFKQL